MKAGLVKPRGRVVRFSLDTSCLVALLAEWHPFHRASVAAYEARLKQGERLVLAGHAVLECFSVLTRLPAPMSAAPQIVEQALSSYLSTGTELAGMTPETCRQALRDLAGRGLGGGRIYDAIIALCSYQAGATILLTWNLKHFLSIAPVGLAVQEP